MPSLHTDHSGFFAVVSYRVSYLLFSIIIEKAFIVLTAWTGEQSQDMQSGPRSSPLDSKCSVVTALVVLPPYGSSVACVTGSLKGFSSLSLSHKLHWIYRSRLISLLFIFLQLHMQDSGTWA